ncbi:MAG TPA: PAS domain S-box protein [Abditibacterium sp.]
MFSAESNVSDLLEAKIIEPTPAPDLLADGNELSTEAPSETTDILDAISDLPPQADFDILPVVGLGGSAGSIGALQRFLDDMPADSGMAFVVVLHLAPDHESQLCEALQSHTAMPVVSVTQQVKVEANHVYVIPPGQHLVMQGGQIQLRELENKFGTRVAVDLFFRTLAASHRSRAVAVILSGLDSDGAIGIKRVKEHGGVTIAQDPDEAEHDGMPRSAIQTGMVDWVLPVDQMAARLLEFWRNEQRMQFPPSEVQTPNALSDGQNVDETALREVLAFLLARTGHDFAHYKRATVLRRIGRRLQVNSLANLPEYLTFLRTHNGEAGALLQDLLISVTNFFRDPEAFAALQTQIPALFRGKKSGEQVRVWIAGCATGEEAYSVAMLLVEHALTLVSPPSIQVFATDIDEEATRAAREGRFPQAIAADVSPERLRRFFILDQGYYRVRTELRELVLFASHNILRDSPFSNLDLVTCRNLLIYFQPEAQERVFNLFHFALRPDGVMFLGSSEATNETGGLFAVLDKKQRIYSRRAGSRRQLHLPALLAPTALRLPQTPSLTRPEMLAAPNFSPRPREHSVPNFSELHLRLLEQYSPPSVLVTFNFDIVHLSERAGRFLHFAGGNVNVSINLINAVHPALRLELRSALVRAVQSGESVDVPGLPLELDGSPRLVDLRVRVLREEERSENAVNYLMVVFDDRESDQPADTVLTRTEDDVAVRRLEREAGHLKQHLASTVEQYEAMTEELKASNEELQAMNEEMRSAGEELETSKEELSASNEELITVNQEMKSKVEQLARSNGDLQNLMSATSIATIFLDRDLRIQRFTPPAVELFKLIPTDAGRPLSDLRHSLQYEAMIADAQQVIDKLLPVEREVPGDDGRWFLVRVLPYRTADDRIDGVVFTFVDITRRHEAETDLRQSEERYRTLFEAMDEAYYVMEMIFDAENRPLDYRFLRNNPAFEKLTGLTNSAGKRVRELIPDIEESWIETYGQVALTGVSGRFDGRVAGLDGRWYDGYAFRVGGDDSRQVAVVFSDITERKQNEEALRESEARIAADLAGMRRLYDLQSKLEQQSDVEEAFRDILAAACEFTGTDRGCVQFLSDDATRLEMFVWQGYEDNGPFIEFFRYEGLEEGCEVARVQRKRLIIEDTATFPGLVGTEAGAVAQADGIGAAQSTPMTNRSGETIGVISTQFRQPHRPSDHELRLMDMLAWTAAEFLERFRADAALRESEARMRHALSIETVGVLFYSLDGRIHDANAAFQRICGYTVEELRTTAHWEKLTAPEFIEPTMRSAQNLAERGETPPYEKVMIRPDGTRWWGLFAPTRLSGSGPNSECVEFIIDITEAKATQEALRESEEAQRLAIEAAEMGTWQWDLTADTVYWNERHFLLLGMTPHSNPVNPTEFFNRIHLDDREAVVKRLQTALEEKSTFAAEFCVVLDTGETRWMSGYGRVVEEAEDGRAACMSGVMIDINERKVAEKRISDVEARFRTLVESVQDYAIITMTPDNLIETWNPGAAKIFGYEAAEILGQPGDILFVPEDREKREPEKELETARHEGRAADERWHLRKEGSRFYASGVMTALRANPRQGFVKILRDLTAEKQAKEALEASELRFRTQSDALPQIIWTNEPGGVANHFNKRWFEYSGLSFEASFGPGWQKIVHPADGIIAKQRWQAALEAGAVFETEYRLRRADSSYRWHIGRNVPLRDNDGHILGWFGTATDIQELKDAEEGLRESHDLLEARVQERTQSLQERTIALQDEIAQRQRLQSQTRQLMQRIVQVQEDERRRISRELHDNLGQHATAIMLTLQAMQDSEAHRPEGERRKTAAQLARLHQAMDDLMNMTHRLAWELRPAILDNVGLEAALNQYVKEWERPGMSVDFLSRLPQTEGAKAEIGISPDAETALYRVVQECLSNVLRHAQASQASVLLERRANHVTAIVEDDGCGFDVEAISTSKRLGVRGMQERMELVGGTLEVESQLGGGTTIYARVPLSVPRTENP